MLTFSMISVALATSSGDQTMTYVIIGVIVFILLVAAASSSGTSAKQVVKKYECPHCHRQINYTDPVIKSVQHSSHAARAQNVRLSNQSKMIPRQNARVELRGSKKFCPYCNKQIIGS